MKPGSVSQTAQGTAAGRAIESRRSKRDRFFQDPFAREFLPLGYRAIVDLDELVPQPSVEAEGGPLVILEFFLDQDGAAEVNLALDVISHRNPKLDGRSQALIYLARSYLSMNEPSAITSPACDDKAKSATLTLQE